MLSLESLDKEGFEDFLLSQTDLKSDDFSVVGVVEFEVRELAAVSYTHLTLPTICSV